MSASDRGRWLWLPLFPLLASAYLTFRILTAGPSTWRIVGLAVDILWLALSLYDWRTRGAVRRWIYSDDDDKS